MNVFNEVVADGSIDGSTLYLLKTADDLFEVLEFLTKKFDAGWKDFRIEKVKQTDGLRFVDSLVIHFRRGKEWKYKMIRMM